MHANLGTILLGSADRRPRHTALLLDERELSFAELDRAARGVAASLRGLKRIIVVVIRRPVVEPSAT